MKRNWGVFCTANFSFSGAGACSGSSPDQQDAALIDAESWTEVEPQTDPFWVNDSSEETQVCGGQDWIPEPPGTEVNTADCNYLTLAQPSLVTIERGDTIFLTAWWQTLVSREPAIGHLAVFVGDTPVLDEQIEIPGEADARELRFTSPRGFPAGTPIYFHIHNHGFNSWSLGSLTLQP